MNVTETWQCELCKKDYDERTKANMCFANHRREPEVMHWFRCGICKERYFLRERAEKCCNWNVFADMPAIDAMGIDGYGNGDG